MKKTPKKDATDRLLVALEFGETLGGTDTVANLTTALAPRDLRRLFGTIDLDQQANLLAMLEPEEGAEILNHLAEAQATDLLEFLPAEDAADLIELLPSPDGGDLIRSLDVGGQDVLGKVENDMGRIRLQANYPEDTAGSSTASRSRTMRRWARCSTSSPNAERATESGKSNTSTLSIPMAFLPESCHSETWS